MKILFFFSCSLFFFFLGSLSPFSYNSVRDKTKKNNNQLGILEPFDLDPLVPFVYSFFFSFPFSGKKNIKI